jgi:hypothetical protein
MAMILVEDQVDCRRNGWLVFVDAREEINIEERCLHGEGLRLNFDDAGHLETEMRTWQAFDWRTATMRDLQLESNRRGEEGL